MAFNDDPIIDKNSIRSEKSVLAVRSLFTRENKYIFREEFIDNGIDANIELINDNFKASSKIFAIQIKSKKKVSIISYKNTKYISLPFETSRLGYLCRRPPAYGIIFIYDDDSDQCFYGYVEDIITELDNHSDRTEWRNQESVSILIPESNQFNKESVIAIHSKMTILHNSHDNLIRFQGVKYGVPVITYIPKSEFEFDEKDSTQVATFLSKYGWALFNQGEYNHLGRLIKCVNHIDINKPELFLLSAVLYAQIGNTIECEYYLRKSKIYLNDFTKEQTSIYHFTIIRCDFLKGEIDLSGYLNKLEEFKYEELRIENQITVEINLIFLKLIDQVHGNFDKNIIEDINKLFLKIESKEVRLRSQILFKLYHSENLHLYALNLLMHNFRAMKLKESLGFIVGIDQRLSELREFLRLREQAVKVAQEIYQADESDDHDKYAKALSAYYQAKFFKDTAFQSMLMGIMHDDNPETIQVYEGCYNLAIEAYNSFISQQLYQNAHSALSTAIEIAALCRRICKATIGQLSEAELKQILRSIEKENDLRGFADVVDQAYDGMNKSHVVDKKTFWESLSEKVMEEMAIAYIQGRSLPIERKQNLLNEMKSHKIFYENCNNEYIELLVEKGHLDHSDTAYKNPSSFILKHTLLGIETKPNTDVMVLIDQFSTIINNINENI